jgi:hypothetical protein
LTGLASSESESKPSNAYLKQRDNTRDKKTAANDLSSTSKKVGQDRKAQLKVASTTVYDHTSLNPPSKCGNRKGK